MLYSTLHIFYMYIRYMYYVYVNTHTHTQLFHHSGEGDSARHQREAVLRRHGFRRGDEKGGHVLRLWKDVRNAWWAGRYINFYYYYSLLILFIYVRCAWWAGRWNNYFYYYSLLLLFIYVRNACWAGRYNNFYYHYHYLFT